MFKITLWILILIAANAFSAPLDAFGTESTTEITAMDTTELPSTAATMDTTSVPPDSETTTNSNMEGEGTTQDTEPTPTDASNLEPELRAEETINVKKMFEFPPEPMEECKTATSQEVDFSPIEVAVVNEDLQGSATVISSNTAYVTSTSTGESSTIVPVAHLHMTATEELFPNLVLPVATNAEQDSPSSTTLTTDIPTSTEEATTVGSDMKPESADIKRDVPTDTETTTILTLIPTSTEEVSVTTIESPTPKLAMNSENFQFITAQAQISSTPQNEISTLPTEMSTTILVQTTEAPEVISPVTEPAVTTPQPTVVDSTISTFAIVPASSPDSSSYSGTQSNESEAQVKVLVLTSASSTASEVPTTPASTTTATAESAINANSLADNLNDPIAIAPEPRSLSMAPPKLHRHLSEDGVEVISGYSFVTSNQIGETH